MAKRSFFVRLRNAYERFQTAGLYNPEESHRNEVDQRDMMRDQMQAYKDQTELARQEIERVRGEKNAEKRRIEEKQIRTLRRNYRPAGFLNNDQGPATGVTDKLGG